MFFGNLFVLGPSRKIRKYGSPLWMFYAYCCACGENYIEREAKQLSRKSTQSCGCIRFLGSSKNKADVVKSLHFKKYLYHAKNRNVVVKLKEHEFYKLFSLNCYYCNSSPKLIKSYKGGKYNIKLNGVDRLNNNFGYTTDNVVPCCTECNIMKQTLSEKAFIGHLIKIYNHLKL